MRLKTKTVLNFAAHAVGFLLAAAVVSFAIGLLGFPETTRSMACLLAGMPVGLATLLSYLRWSDRIAYQDAVKRYGDGGQ